MINKLDDENIQDTFEDEILVEYEFNKNINEN
jgi:hypothetical protein